MLEAVALTKRYGAALALDALTLRVEPGEIFCLLGQNGAGKTTTINCFLGFVEPTSGQALVDGVDVARDPAAARAALAYIPETVLLYPQLTGVENLRFFTQLGGARYAAAELRALLGEAGLPDGAADRRLSEYSKGMRQKVGIAIALAKGARALLLDEPTSGLDPKASHEFTRLLQRLGERGCAVLMATHDIFRAREAGTRVGIMSRGRLTTTLPAAELTASELEALYLRTLDSEAPDGASGTAPHDAPAAEVAA